MVRKEALFRDRLEAALVLRNMRPIDLAEKTHISQSTISQYRSGYAEPKADRLAIISAALDVNPAWLMGISAPMEMPSEQREYNRLVDVYRHRLERSSLYEKIDKLDYSDCIRLEERVDMMLEADKYKPLKASGE